MTNLLFSLVFVVALAAVAVGVGMIFVPAGVIVGGLLAAGVSVLAVIGGDRQ